MKLILFWRPDATVIGIEVKASASVNVNDFKDLAKLADFCDQTFSQGVLFYTGQTILPFKYDRHTFYALPFGLFVGG